MFKSKLLRGLSAVIHRFCLFVSFHLGLFCYSATLFLSILFSYPWVCLSLCQSLPLSSLCLSVSLYLYVSPSLCLSVGLCVSLSFCLCPPPSLCALIQLSVICHCGGKVSFPGQEYIRSGLLPYYLPNYQAVPDDQLGDGTAGCVGQGHPDNWRPARHCHRGPGQAGCSTNVHMSPLENSSEMLAS